MQKNMMYAHAMASLESNGFYLNVSNSTPELTAANGSARLIIEHLNPAQLLAVKNLAHDQYVRAMLSGKTELSPHRATLNFLSRMLQRLGSQGSQANNLRQPTRQNRRQRLASKKAA